MKPKDMEGGLAAYFEQDHRDCDARWADVEELLSAADIELARAAWQKYAASLRRHIAMEEEVLFPAFEAKGERAGATPIAIMKMEHQQMTRLDYFSQDAVDFSAGWVIFCGNRGQILWLLSTRFSNSHHVR